MRQVRVTDDTFIMIGNPDRQPQRRFDSMAEFKFFAGSRVCVSQDFFWAKGAVGTISEPPDAVIAISGPWDGNLTRQERSVLGSHTVYWVWFDEPQLDAGGDGPYSGGQIWESALTLLKTNVN